MIDRERSVYVLLGTFNGAKYIDAQVDSLRAQTVTDWALLVRDDGSTDGTRERMERLAGADTRVQVVNSEGGNLGCVGNFSRLAEIAFQQNARYVMFADQDDVWHPDKIERTLDRMLAAELKRRPDVPILVHTDLEVVDHNGRRVHPSFMRLQKIRHEADNPLRILLVQNFVTGCTAMLNRPLLALGTPIPGEVLMHDWWFAACAAACGAVEFVPHQTMSYRRHGANTVTVRGFWRTMNPFLTDWRRLWSTAERDHVRAVRQAEALRGRLQEKNCGDEAAKQLICEFVDLHQEPIGRIARVGRAAALRLRSQTFPRTAALYMRFLLWER